MSTFGSLFAGIGGIDLGLERAGWECRWQVEWDAYCQRVLAKHWPDVTRYGDITTVDWSGVERVDLLAGGFPCQPVSEAGLKLAQDDARWLWPEFYRAIRALRPQVVLVENVPGLLARGLDEVLGDLATIGYDAEWDCLPAAAVGALHIRDRVWIVAYSEGVSGELRTATGERPWGPPGRSPALSDANGGRREPGSERAPFGGVPQPLADGDSRHSWAAPDTERGRRDRGTPDAERRPQRRTAAFEAGAAPRRSDYWLTEPDVGRVAHGVPSRVDRLRALGNAVVPQVVEVIGRQLLASMEDVA